MKRTFPLVTVFLCLLFGSIACNNYGKKVQINAKSEVYYTDGASEVEAKKLGDYLLEAGYFDKETAKTVQLSKTADTFNVKFVVDKQRVEESLQVTEKSFAALEMLISLQVFNSKPVKVILADQYLKGFREINPQSLDTSSSKVDTLNSH